GVLPPAARGRARRVAPLRQPAGAGRTPHTAGQVRLSMQPVLPADADATGAPSPASVLAGRFAEVRAYLSAPTFPLDAAAAESLARRAAAPLPAPAGPTLDPRHPRFGGRGDGG